MSQVKTTVAKDEAAPVSPVFAAAASDDAKSSHSTEVKDLSVALKQLSQQRRILRQVQINYRGIKKSQFKHLKIEEGEVDKTTEEVTAKDKTAPKDPEETAKDQVKAAHRLIRNFNYAINVQIMSREDDKRVLPHAFADEIESLFDDKEALGKIKKALKADNKEDQIKELPDKLSKHTLKGIADFLEKHEKKEIIDKIETQLTDLTTKIDEKRARLNTLRPESKKATKSTPSTGQSKRSRSSKKKSTATHSDLDEEQSAEEKFRHLIREVNQRVKAVKLKKGDYELYVKMETEIDAFLHEAITEINAIKTRFKKRFDEVQSGKSPARRSRSRSNRRQTTRRANDLSRS